MLELFKQSTIIQGLLALVLVGGVTYQAVTGQQISEALLTLAGTAVGFYFGVKQNQAVGAIERATAKALGRGDGG